MSSSEYSDSDTDIIFGTRDQPRPPPRNLSVVQEEPTSTSRGRIIPPLPSSDDEDDASHAPAPVITNRRPPLPVDSSDDEDDDYKIPPAATNKRPAPPVVSSDDEDYTPIKKRRTDEWPTVSGNSILDTASGDEDAENIADKKNDEETLADYDDWGSVEPASDNEDRISLRKPAEDDNDWGSVEAASDNEDRISSRKPVGDDNDWGSVEPASDNEDRISLRKPAEDDNDWGSVEAASDNEDRISSRKPAEDDNDWGSVEAASDNEDRISSRKPVGDDNDWGSVEPTSDNEDRVGSRQPAEDDNDWGSVEPASDNEDRISGQRGEGKGIENWDWGNVDPVSDDEASRRTHGEPVQDTGYDTATSKVTDTRRRRRTPSPESSPEPEPPSPSAISKTIRFARKQYQKRPKTYSKAYYNLLEDAKTEAKERRIYSDEPTTVRVHSTYVLESWWSRGDKEKFFDRLAVLGRGNLDKIAAEIGKTHLECQTFLVMCEEARNGPNSIHKEGMKAIPEAVEVSRVIGNMLNRQARLLRHAEHRWIRKQEQAAWGKEFWRIDEAAAAQLSIWHKDGEVELIEENCKEAELLNVENMIQLSKRIFMNRPDYNYHAVQANDDDEPAFLHDALEQLHHLVIAVTRSLVAASIFKAESRVEMMRNPVFGHFPQIRPDDIHAAAEVLGLAKNTWDYWITAPRRFGLTVVKRLADARLLKTKNAISYKEVERFLSHVPVQKQRQTSSGLPKKKTTEEYDEDELLDNEDDITEDAPQAEEEDNGTGGAEGEVEDMEDALDIISDSDDAELDGSVQVSGEGHPNAQRLIYESRVQKLEAKQDAYLERLGLKHAIDEERHLWEILGYGPKNPGDKMDPEDEAGPDSDGEIPLVPPITEAIRDQRKIKWRDTLPALTGRMEWEGFPSVEEGYDEIDDEWLLDDSDDSSKEEQRLRKIRASASASRKRKNHPETSAAKATKQRKVATQNTSQAPKEKPSPKKKAKKIKGPPLAASQRQNRQRRKSSVPSGFVSTVEVVSDEEQILENYGDSEDDVDGVYREEM